MPLTGLRCCLQDFWDKKQHGFYETAGGDERNKHGVNKSQWKRNKNVQPKQIPKGNGYVLNSNGGETQPSRSRRTTPVSKKWPPNTKTRRTQGARVLALLQSLPRERPPDQPCPPSGTSFCSKVNE